MPTLNPSQLHELVQNLIQDNNNNLIDPADVRDVLDAIIDSVYNLVATPNPTAPSLENVLVEGNETGAKDIIATTGRYIIFKDSVNNQVRLRPVQGMPGTPVVKNIVLPLRAGTVALLDDISSSWLDPVLGERDQPLGSEVAGDRWIVGTGATGEFAGHPGDIAERTNDGWVFSATQDGDMVRCVADTAGIIRTKTTGLWVMPPDLSDVLSLDAVLGVGNTTNGHDIEVSAADAVTFRNNGFAMRLIGQDIAADHNVTMPEAGGTLALTSQLPDLSSITLQVVLVNGNETQGRSIQISEFDGINFIQGANYVRVKGPVAVAAARTLLLPDKDGTIATTSDVDAVAALIDGALKSPEAYTPAGTYPVTYNSAAIVRGDSFRLGAGTMGARTVNAEDLAIALTDAPGQVDANWQVIESNRVVATQTEAEDSASTDLAKLMPPQRWWQAWTKGLTLATFGTAVRGMLLTGYTVGDNAAVAATDSILGAVAKLQGQVNARLAKASNLSDLPSKPTARTNLGLGALATQDYADRVITDEFLLRGEPITAGQLVVVNDEGRISLATPTNAQDGRIGVAVEIESGTSNVRVQFSGICDEIADTPGSVLWLDPATPGGYVTARPKGNAVYIGRIEIGAERLVFAPAMPLPSGSAVLGEAEPSNVAAGTVSSLATMDLVGGGVYEINVYAQTNAATGAGRTRLWLDCDQATARGEVVFAKSATNESMVKLFIVDDLTLPVNDAGDASVGEDTEQHLGALVVLDAHTPGPVSVKFGPLNDGFDVILKAGSIITWNRIG